MKLISTFNLSNESIDFQTNSTFGKELENTIQDINDNKVAIKKLQDSEQKKILESIIKKHTGLNINLVLDTQSVACVYLPTVHRNHLFLYNSFRDLYDIKDSIEIFKRVKEINEKHTVNLKTGKVTGLFSDLSVDIHLQVNSFFSAKMPAGQITAILLHEIGHLFTYYEFIVRQHTTNQVLAGILKSVINKDNIKTRETVFEKGGALLGDKNAFKEIVNQDNSQVISTVVFQQHVDHMKSELGIEHYDYSACEQLADQYSTRYGYGRELILGLETLHRMFGIYEGKASNFEAGLSQIAGVIVMTVGVVFGFAANPLASLFFAGMLVLSLYGAGASKKDYTYDVLKVRYLRVREQFIQRLKDKSISQEEITLNLDSLKAIDKVISSIHEHNLPLDRMMNFIFSTNRDVKRSTELQRQLESLAMNDLFAKSAKLSTI